MKLQGAVVGSSTAPPASSALLLLPHTGDFNDVEIGGFTSIGEGAVVNTSKSEERTPDNATRIGDYVTVGAGAVLQSCTVESHAVIGAGAVVMDGAIVENHSHVGPGSVVHPDQRVPSGQLWAGNPAKFVRNLTPEEKASFEIDAEAVAETAEEHADVFLEHGAAYLEAESRYASVVDKLESGDAFREKPKKVEL